MIWVYRVPMILINLAIALLILDAILAYIRLLKYRKDLNWFLAILKVPSAMLKPIHGMGYNSFEWNVREYDKKMRSSGAKRLGWGPRGVFMYVSKTEKVHVYSGHTDEEHVLEPEDLRGGYSPWKDSGIL